MDAGLGVPTATAADAGVANSGTSRLVNTTPASRAGARRDRLVVIGSSPGEISRWLSDQVRARIGKDGRMAKDNRVLAQYRRKVTEDSYTEIRELYKSHSVAEDNRDIAGLLATLSTDCVYELCQTGVRWEGHDGAARFYTELLTAF